MSNPPLQPPTASTPAASPSDPSPRILPLFVGLILTMLMSALGQTVLSTALPTIIGELNGADHMVWVITTFILASTIVMPICGRISDVIGRRPVLLVEIVIFLAGSVIGGLAQDMGQLIVARVVQGLGAGGLLVLSQATMADVVPARERGKYMGIFGATFAVSSVAGPLVGGWLTDEHGWRWAFWINLPLGVLAFTAVWLFARAPRRSHDAAKVDFAGMALVAVATTAAVLVCTWGGTTYGWGSPIILGLIALAVVAAIALALVERRAPAAVLPGFLFRNRNFLLATGAGLVVGVAMFGSLGYLPTYIQMVTGVSASTAGLLMTPMMGAVFTTSIIAGQLVSRSGRYKHFPVSGMLILAVGLVLLSTLKVDDPVWLICIYLAVVGTGIGLSMQILTLVVQNEFPGVVVGTATAANNYFRQVGSTIGSAVVGSLFGTRLVAGLEERLAALQQHGSVPGLSPHSLTPAAVNALPDEVRQQIIAAYNEALLPILLFIVPPVLLGFVLVLFIRPTPLKTALDHRP